MAQFDLYANPSRRVAEDMPFVVDVQSEFLRHLPTRILIPLARQDSIKASPHLNPLLTVNGEPLVLLTNHLASLPSTMLDHAVGSLAEHRHDIIAALDFLFTGI